MAATVHWRDTTPAGATESVAARARPVKAVLSPRAWLSCPPRLAVIVYRRLLGIIAGVKIYTRTGDAGRTALFDGSRVSKADPRVEAYGHVDELNAVLGQARAAGVDSALDA